MNNNFLKNAKISKKGQVTIPKEIRTILNVDSRRLYNFWNERGEYYYS